MNCSNCLCGVFFFYREERHREVPSHRWTARNALFFFFIQYSQYIYICTLFSGDVAGWKCSYFSDKMNCFSHRFTCRMGFAAAHQSRTQLMHICDHRPLGSRHISIENLKQYQHCDVFELRSRPKPSVFAANCQLQWN